MRLSNKTSPSHTPRSTFRKLLTKLSASAVSSTARIRPLRATCMKTEEATSVDMDGTDRNTENHDPTTRRQGGLVCRTCFVGTFMVCPFWRTKPDPTGKTGCHMAEGCVVSTWIGEGAEAIYLSISESGGMVLGSDTRRSSGT